MMEVPCKDCKRRQIRCHTVCQMYSEFLKQNEIVKENRKKAIMQDSLDFSPKYFEK